MKAAGIDYFRSHLIQERQATQKMLLKATTQESFRESQIITYLKTAIFQATALLIQSLLRGFLIDYQLGILQSL